MAKTQLIRKSFNAGELSPELHYRDDLAAYVKGCKHLTNMIPTPYGAVTRRPPFEILAKIDTAVYGVPVRYIPFKFSLTEVFHIVFTDGSGSDTSGVDGNADLIIFDEFGSQVIFEGNPLLLSALPLPLDGTTEQGPSTLSSVYLNRMVHTIYKPEDLHEIHFINVNDFIYLTCGGKYPVQAINRFFDEDENANRWKIEEWVVNGLLGPQNIDPNKTIRIVFGDGSPAALVANFDNAFTSTDLGREVAVGRVYSSPISGNWTENNTSSTTPAYGIVELIAEGGRWDGVLSLEASTDNEVTWTELKQIRSQDGSSNGSVEVEIFEINTRIRVVLRGWNWGETGSTVKCLFKVVLKDVVKNHVRITGSISSDGRSAYCEPISGLTESISADFRWSMGVMSETSGYPFCITIHDERLCLGGSRDQPNTVFASRVNDWKSYLQGSTETSPYTFTIASDSFDTIRSIRSSRQLNILTDNAENTMGSRDDNAITSITNIAVSSHTNYGSNEVQAVQLADMIWFVMGQGERVRASKYDFASDGQQSVEMSLFSSHITESGIKEMSFRRHPFNSLFCLLNNGTGAVLTYEGMQEIRAWATVKTDGDIISASSNYSDTGDIIAGIVKRGDQYFLEKFGSVDADTVFLDNQTNWVDANFDLGQPFTQKDDGGLVVVLNDAELVRDVDYTIEGQFEAYSADLEIDGAFRVYGTNYYNLESYGFNYEARDYFTLYKDGVLVPAGIGPDQNYDVRFLLYPNETTGLYDRPYLFFYNSTYDSEAQYTVVVDQTNMPKKLIIPSQITGNVCIGRRIECRVNPTDISEVAPSGVVKRLTELGMYLLDSGTCNVEINGKPSPFSDGLKWVAGQRESGLFELTTGGDYEQGLDVNITIDGHRHFTLTGLGYRLGISQG